MTRRRLDAELVRRGLAASRAEAQEAVRAGLVTVAGAPATKAATMVADDARGRAGGAGPAVRLAGRREARRRARPVRASIPPGSSAWTPAPRPGGSPIACCAAGAAHVTAVDVGYGQLAWSLRTDERVTVLERTNVRELHPGDLPYAPELVVADLSFISLRLVLAGARGRGRARRRVRACW